MRPSAEQRAACRSIGNKQCAAICLSHSCLIELGDCPSVSEVWTPEAIARERARRPNGPLKEITPTMSIEHTDAESAAVAKAPRVSLASMEAKIVERYDITGADAVAHIMPPTSPSLPILSICILVMENGFTIIGKAAPASAENFNRELGKKFAYEDAIRQIWPMEGYLLRSDLQSQARVKKLEEGIDKALLEVEDSGPKTMKYVEQELRAALAK